MKILKFLLIQPTDTVRDQNKILTKAKLNKRMP